MPDWFYKTVSQPVLFRLPAHMARDIALGFMGRLARLPLGPKVIDFLGHMRADVRLKKSFLSVDFQTSVGLGPWLDTRARALPALARFGFGFLEAGPVTLEGCAPSRAVARVDEREAFWFAEPPESIPLREFKGRLTEASRQALPVIVRIGYANDTALESLNEECAQLVQELSTHAALFSLSTLKLFLAKGWTREDWVGHVRAVMKAAREVERPILLCLPSEAEADLTAPFIEAALAEGLSGLILNGTQRAEPEGMFVGLPVQEQALRCVRRLRARFGRELLIIAAGGIHEPEHALKFKAAGADLVQVDSGLVFTGPGLPKRINDAFLFEETRATREATAPLRLPDSTWFWTLLMGAGMLLGSLIAVIIAATKVVLPYDEAFVGLSREGLSGLNPRLLAFMAHDRVSLAGTMIAIGVMYVGLSWYGIRRGLHWAQQSVFISAFTGFVSFFLFLGFGYLDTFHAFVTGALLQLLLLGFHARLGVYVPKMQADLRGDWRWRLSLWGQLLLIVHGFALLAAGAAISLIGITKVFVPEDLEFMRTTSEALRAANPRLVPLIAHDRATFGGMLLSSGWVLLLPSLWGYRRGAAWLWWSFLIAGLAAYIAAIGVHYTVGYESMMHLLPAIGGLLLFLLGLALSYPFLCQKT